MLGLTLAEFTLVLGVIGLAILTVIPMIRTWERNQEIREAADRIRQGLHAARMEAMRRNASVKLLLADASLQRSCGAAHAEARWIVSLNGGLDSCDDVAGNDAERQGILRSGTVAATPNIALTSAQNEFRFNGAGRPANNAVLQARPVIQVAHAGGRCRQEGGEVRCLRVELAPSGHASICDPALDRDSTSPLRCNFD